MSSNWILFLFSLFAFMQCGSVFNMSDSFHSEIQIECRYKMCFFSHHMMKIDLICFLWTAAPKGINDLFQRELSQLFCSVETELQGIVWKQIGFSGFFCYCSLVCQAKNIGIQHSNYFRSLQSLHLQSADKYHILFIISCYWNSQKLPLLWFFTSFSVQISLSLIPFY